MRLDRTKGHAEDLFDRSDDPEELRDRSADQPEILEHLRKVADEYLESKPAFGAAPARDVDQLELNQLRALGYAIP